MLGEVEGLHLNDDVDAPAVGQPVGEVGVVVRGAAPGDGAVAHLVAPGLLLVLVALEEDLVDLLAGLDGTRVEAAVHLIAPLAEQLVGRAD